MATSNNCSSLAGVIQLLLTIHGNRATAVPVLDLVSQVRDVVLMNVYLDLGNSGGRDFGMGGI
jgi:hypothetical protein